MKSSVEYTKPNRLLPCFVSMTQCKVINIFPPTLPKVLCLYNLNITVRPLLCGAGFWFHHSSVCSWNSSYTLFQLYQTTFFLKFIRINWRGYYPVNLSVWTSEKCCSVATWSETLQNQTKTDPLCVWTDSNIKFPVVTLLMSFLFVCVMSSRVQRALSRVMIAGVYCTWSCWNTKRK